MKFVASRIGGGAIHVRFCDGSRGLPGFVGTILTLRGIEFGRLLNRGGNKAFDGPHDSAVGSVQKVAIDDRLRLATDAKLRRRVLESM